MIKFLLRKYKIYFIFGVAIGLFVFGWYGGYKISEAKWLSRQAGIEAKYRQEQEVLVKRASEAEKAAINAKQKRKVIYREKKIYITESIPDCPAIDADRLRELQCITSPSKCER